MKQSLIDTQTSMGIEVDEDEIDRELDDIRSMSMSIEFWIDTDDYLIRQMRTNIQSSDDSGDSDITTADTWMKYYDFYEPITIEAPVDADGRLMPGWQMENLRRFE